MILPVLIVLVLGMVLGIWVLSGIVALLKAVIIGFLAGAVARWIIPGQQSGGFLMTVLLGLGGSMLITILQRLLNFYPLGHNGGLIASIVGAMVLLLLGRLIQSKEAVDS